MEYWNAPATQPAPPQIDIAAGAVYREKKRLADALRKKAEREHTPVSGLIQSEGANGSPGYTQIDYAGILNNFMQPGFQKAREEKAAAAESDADAARSAALDQLLGRQGLTAADAIRAKSDLGVDVSSAVKDPAAEKLALTRMIAQNPALAYMLPQEERDAFTAYSSKLSDTERTADREDFKWKQDNTYRAPSTDLTFEQRMALAQAGRSGASDGKSGLTPGLLSQYGKEVLNVKDQYGVLKSSQKSLGVMDDLIYGKVGEDGKRVKSDAALGPMTALISHGADMGIPMMQYAQSAPARQLETLINDQILGKAKLMPGALSNKDLAFLEKSLLSLKDNPESAAAIYEGVKARLEGAEDRLLNSRKGMVDTDDRLGGLWLDPRAGGAEPSAAPQAAGETIQQRIARLKGAK